MKLSTSLIILGSVALNAFVSVPLKEMWTKSGYEQGYNECTTNYKQMLLDEGFAEYDKKTAEWHLLDASTIQGNLIPAPKRILYTTVEDQIQSYEDELRVLKKQKEIASKRQPRLQTAKLDMKKF